MDEEIKTEETEIEEIKTEETENNENVNEETEKSAEPYDPADDDKQKENKSGLYLYDAEDEPVDDRDLYSDYSRDTHIVSPKPAENKVPKAPQPAPAAPVQPQPAPQQTYALPVQQPAANVPQYNYTAENAPGYPEKKPKSREKERQSSGRPSIALINTVISMITLCVAAGGIFTAFAYMRSHEMQIRADEARVDRLEQKIIDMSARGSEEDEYVDAIRLIEEEEKNEPDVPKEYAEVDRGKIITYDSYVGYSWVPVLPGVKTNSYDKSGFSVDDEYRLKYVVDGEVSSYFGIDVSAHNGDIDWNAARADGVEFAILRIGVRGYGEEGNIRLDDKFFQNYDGARDAGIDIGVYFYSQAISVEEAVEEANFVLEQLGGRKLEYPVAFDWEPVDSTIDGSVPRTDEVMPGTFNLSARAFCETIEDAGYRAMIYTNKKMAYLKYDLRLFEGYPVWLALYNTDMTYYYDFDIWQYGVGKVAGIEGDVDVNIAIIR